MSIYRALAERCLNYSGITELPVDLYKLKCPYKEWEIYSYSEGWELIEKLGLVDFSRKNAGFATSTGKRLLIFVNDQLVYVEQHVTLAHEIAHLILDHVKVGKAMGVYAYHMDAEAFLREREREANMLALELLAPPSLLLKHHITTPYGISRATMIDEDKALLVAREVRRYAKDEKARRARILA